MVLFCHFLCLYYRRARTEPSFYDTLQWNGTSLVSFHSTYNTQEQVMQTFSAQNSGMLLPYHVLLTIALSTTGETSYSLVGFSDPNSNTPVDGLQYQNTPLQNCSIQQLEIVQTLVPTTNYQVLSHSSC